jgi:YfiH family protein
VTITRRLGPASVLFTGRAEGDMGQGGAYVSEVHPEVEARRRRVVDRPWTWLRQVHGDELVRVAAPGASAGTRADAAITDQPGCVLAVLTADCAPVALVSDEGAIGMAHAGWRGLVAGVVQRTAKELRALGATDVRAVIGPCIHAECYEFAPDDLECATGRYGPTVAGRSSGGKPSLDLPAAVRAALAEQGIVDVDDVDVCTACSSAYYSWRARGELERQAALVWR